MADTSFIINWRGVDIGRIINTSIDSWLMEGGWVSNQSPQALKFTALVTSFSSQEVYHNPKKGTRVLLRPAGDGGSVTIHALVLKMAGDTLMLRNVYEADAVKWLIKNVQ